MIFTASTLWCGARSRGTCGRSAQAGAQAAARLSNCEQLISFDMGGTTAKVGLIQDGRLRLSTEMEVGAQAVTPLGEGRGGGYPVRTPVIDLVEVGAGGGSEAWIDAGGALRVGPRSAGARPGPACYGLGGTTPTITDANLANGIRRQRERAGRFFLCDGSKDANGGRGRYQTRQDLEAGRRAHLDALTELAGLETEHPDAPAVLLLRGLRLLHRGLGLR